MALSIKDPQTEELVREMAKVMGASLTESIAVAAGEWLEHHGKQKMRKKATTEELMAIARSFHALPVLDPRTPDEILGYDEYGLPT